MMFRTHAWLLLAATAALPVAVFACKPVSNLPGPPPTLPSASASGTPSTAMTGPTPTYRPTGTGRRPPVPAPSVEAGKPSEDPKGAAPGVRFSSPSKGQVIEGAKAVDFPVRLDVRNWKTADGDANIHVSLDGKPHIVVVRPSEPLILSHLFEGKELTEGHHVLVAYATRATHESVKAKDAVAIQDFYIGRKTEPKWKTDKPFLIYSQPSGEYEGADSSRILIDFLVANATLGPKKERVELKVSGPGLLSKPIVIEEQKPYYLQNPRTGTYTVTIALKDADNKPVDGPHTSITRSFKVNTEVKDPPGKGKASAVPSASAVGSSVPLKKL